MVFTLPDFISSVAVNLFLLKCLQTLLVKKITHNNLFKVNYSVMTISWNDEDDPFELKLRNIQTCKNAFKFFPRLTKALKPRLSNYRFLNFRGPNNTKMKKEKKIIVFISFIISLIGAMSCNGYNNDMSCVCYIYENSSQTGIDETGLDNGAFTSDI